MDNEIEQKRRQLIQVANKYGLTSNKTLQCSRELDRLLDIYQKRHLNKDIQKVHS